jgi:two-component sensor histidine kinase/ABC-type amino acid transport substrate-binding protein
LSYYRFNLSLLILLLPIFGSAQSIDFTEKEKSWIKNHPVINFGYDPNYEPYEIYEDGVYTGIVGDYVNIIEEKTGIDMQPIPDLNWDKTLKGLMNGTIKVAPSCGITPSREELFLFTEPYIDDPTVIASSTKGQYIGDIKDLKGKKIALSKNNYSIELISNEYPDIIIVEKNSIEECLEAVISGEVEAFIGNLNVITYYINHKGFYNIKIASPTPFNKYEVAFLVNPEWEEFVGIVQKVFNSIEPKERHQIRKKWIGNEYDSPFFSERFIIWTIIIAIGLIVCFSILYYWNKVLRGIIKRKKETEQQLKESLVTLKKQDEDKKVLLQEIHHRVKNNLQVVSSMIRLQANVNKDPNAVKTLNEAVDRVKTIALIHDKIYKSSDINVIQLNEYIYSLFKDIELQFSPTQKVSISIEGEDIRVSVDTIVPVALILNELVTNSFKYAFETTEEPEIKIEFKVIDEHHIEMIYFDNGKWMENEDSDYFGSSLIEIFTDQLEGDYSLHKEDTGTQYNFLFKTIKFTSNKNSSKKKGSN